ncbi:MAG: tetratricopeptide repeat protein, partial [bacterium]
LLNANFKSPVANEALDLIELLESLADDTLSASRLGRVDYLIMRSRWEEVDHQIEPLLNASSPRVREEANWLKVRALVSQKRFLETLETLERLSQPNDGDLKPDRALWEAGSIALYQLGDTTRAISYWESLLEKYPLSPLTPQVRQQLQALLTPQL